MLPHILHQLADQIQLMKARKNYRLFDLRLARAFVFLFFAFDKNKTLNEIEERIFRQHLFPHIGHRQTLTRIQVARAGIDPFAATFIKRQEKRLRPVELRRHHHRRSVHREAHETARLPQKQSRLRIATFRILAHRVLDILPPELAFQFDRDDRQTVQKNHEVDPLLIIWAYLLHHGKNILLILFDQVRIVIGRGLRVHERNRMLRNLNPML